LKLIKKTSFLAFLGKKNKKGLALKELTVSGSAHLNYEQAEHYVNDDLCKTHFSNSRRGIPQVLKIRCTSDEDLDIPPIEWSVHIQAFI
jgi:hypothetical protein